MELHIKPWFLYGKVYRGLLVCAAPQNIWSREANSENFYGDNSSEGHILLSYHVLT